MFAKIKEKPVVNPVVNTEINKMLMYFLHNPSDFLSLMFHEGEEGSMSVAKSVGFSALKECACMLSGTFNRSINNRREHVEVAILKEINTRFSHIRNPLNILSVGSGLLLQDFILTVRMLLSGHSLRVTLIEPKIDQPDYQKALAVYKCLQYAATELGLSLTIVTFPSMKAYLSHNPIPKVDVAYAIDFEMAFSAFDDVLLIQQALGDHGFFYLTQWSHNYLFSKNECIFTEYHTPSLLSSAEHTQLASLPKVSRSVLEHQRELKDGLTTATGIWGDRATQTILDYLETPYNLFSQSKRFAHRNKTEEDSPIASSVPPKMGLKLRIGVNSGFGEQRNSQPT